MHLHPAALVDVPRRIGDHLAGHGDAAWRRVVFAGYQVNEALMELAHPEAVFMHCLPAHRGEEVTDEVLDGPHSVVVEQAENRLHLQKALMAELVMARIQSGASRNGTTARAATTVTPGV